MKAYRVVLLVLDFEDPGKKELKALIEMARHVEPSVVSMAEAEIGEWDDDNPLKHEDTREAEMKRLFGDKP
jgi:hypothetical protein